jgi:AcrR family transcriptional regulator
VPVAALRRPRGRPRKTPAERDEGNRRQELVRAAARLFHRKGFAATSTRDIAAEAGMQSGSPFYHFKSKSALLHAVMEEGLRSAGQRQTRALEALRADGVSATAISSEAALRALIRAHFDILLGPGSDFVPVMLYEWRSLTPRQRADIAKLGREYEARWMPVLEALRESGRLRTDVRVARLLILGALNWTVQWFNPKMPATLDDLTDAAMDLFLQR